jgi:hypothetical protein
LKGPADARPTRPKESRRPEEPGGARNEVTLRSSAADGCDRVEK